MSLTKAISILPIRVVGLIVALHSVIYGLGYLIPTGGFFETVLYMNVGDIMSQWVFGVILLVTGLLLMYSFLQEKINMVVALSNIQSFIWLFASFVYFLNGFYLLGIGIGLIWSLLSSYVAYSFKNRDRTIDNLILQRMQ